jgi:hypothetical protein
VLALFAVGGIVLGMIDASAKGLPFAWSGIPGALCADVVMGGLVYLPFGLAEAGYFDTPDTARRKHLNAHQGE